MFSGWQALLLIDPRMRLVSAYGLMIFMLVLTARYTGVPPDSYTDEQIEVDPHYTTISIYE